MFTAPEGHIKAACLPEGSFARMGGLNSGPI